MSPSFDVISQISSTKLDHCFLSLQNNNVLDIFQLFQENETYTSWTAGQTFKAWWHHWSLLKRTLPGERNLHPEERHRLPPVLPSYSRLPGGDKTWKWQQYLRLWNTMMIIMIDIENGNNRNDVVNGNGHHAKRHPLRWK